MNSKVRQSKNRRKEIEELTLRMESKIENYFQSEESLQEYLQFMSHFHNYSYRNTVLINTQFPGAYAVGSFNFWKSKGYSVQKGEKGLKILVPNQRQTIKREGKSVSLKQATLEEKERIKSGQLKVNTHVDFAIGHVFDISQTNAKLADLPEIFPQRWLEGEVSDYNAIYQALEAVANENNVKIIEPIEELGTSKGVTYVALKSVALNPRNSELQNVKTLTHELAHAVLHTSKDANYSAEEREFQAELVAYTVSHHLGLNTEEYSLPYIASWTRGKELKEKERLLKEVQRTSHQFIGVIEEYFSSKKDQVLGEQIQKEFLLIDFTIGKNNSKLLNFEEWSELSEGLGEHEFNQRYENKYRIVDLRNLEEPQVFIEWTNSLDLSSQELIPYVELNNRIGELEELYQGEQKLAIMQYNLIFMDSVKNFQKIEGKYTIGESKYVNLHHKIKNENHVKESDYKLLDNVVINKLLQDEKTEINNTFKKMKYRMK